MQNKAKNNLLKLVITAMLSAVALVLFLLELPPLIPAVPHLKLDLSDIPALFAAIIYGPLSGVIVELVKNLLEMLIKGIGTQLGFGNLMNFIVGCAYIVPFAVVYRKMSTTKGTVLACVSGLLSILVIGVGTNYLVTPLFFKFFLHAEISSTELWAAIGVATLTNLVKGVLLSVVSFPIINILVSRLKKFIG